MKRNILTTFFIGLLFLATACDVPQRTRYPSSSDLPSFSIDPNKAGNEKENPEEENIDPTEQTSQDYGPGFEECNLGHRYNGGMIGNFGLCQSSLDKRKLKASFAESDISDGTCFVPMHIQSGKSFQLGIPECVHNQADAIYNIPLTTYRPEPVNAVMVLKFSASQPFQQCMSAKANYMNGYINHTYSASCKASPDAYANCVCSSFVNNYGDSYKQVVFEP